MAGRIHGCADFESSEFHWEVAASMADLPLLPQSDLGPTSCDVPSG